MLKRDVTRERLSLNLLSLSVCLRESTVFRALRRFRSSVRLCAVMPALVAGIHVLLSFSKAGVDGRDKPRGQARP
jgi:hypothetical protein